MDIIQLFKTDEGTIEKSVKSVKNAELQEVVRLFLAGGQIFILRKSVRDALESVFKNVDFVNCGIKKDKIHLLKALKLTSNKNNLIQRRIIFIPKSKGAMKSSLNSLAGHYSASFPSSMIFIPDEYFLIFASDENGKTKVKSKTDVRNSNPITEMVEETARKSEVKQLSEDFVGDTPDMVFVRTMIYVAAQKDSPVLVLGESGTGKDVVASKIYELSKSYRGGFIRVNCSALPETLFESELFGYVKGSFTDATTNKDGIFKVADKSTVFLDEIGDLSLANQAKLLHAIEKKEIRPIGSSESIKVDFRVIAATNRRLDIMMRRQQFRTDLYHRLNSILIYIPPLREHSSDIPLIAKSIWKKDGNKQKLTTEFLNTLKEFHWPGNVRELKTGLRNINNYFGDISPTPNHILAILKQHTLNYDDKLTDDNTQPELLWVEGWNRMVELQNTLAEIKIEIGKKLITTKTRGLLNKSDDLKKFLSLKNERITVLCKEPIYFRNWNLSALISDYRELLDFLLRNWPKTQEQLRVFWQTKMETVDARINQQIFEAVYRKVDA